MKSFLGLLLMVAAPLAAQTPTPQTIIFKVVLTTVASSPVQPPSGDPGQPPVTVGDLPGGSSTGPITNPDPGSTTGSPTTGCDGYSNAISAMNHVYANLLYMQQIYTAAETTKSANHSAFTSNSNTLVGMQLYSQDIRDLIRIGGPKDMLTQDVASMSTKVAKLPALLGNNPKLPLASLIVDMQTNLTKVHQLVLTSSCSESLP